MSPEQLTEQLYAALRKPLAVKVPVFRVDQLSRLSGGAVNETWRLEWGDTPLILRRRPFSADSVDNLEGNILGLSLKDEAAVIQLATAAAVPVPEIYAVFDEAHPVGAAFLMDFIPGESIPQRWLTDVNFEAARDRLAVE